MRPTAAELTSWLFTDIAFRQDAKTGATPKRRYRRNHLGRRMMIFVRRVKIWGICYQDGDKRVRRDDFLYRLTLAIMAFEEEKNSREVACDKVLCIGAVIRQMGQCKDRLRKMDSPRVRVIRYLNRRKKDGICLKSGLRQMQLNWRLQHMEQLRQTEWHHEYLKELKERVCRVAVESGEGTDSAIAEKLRLSHIVNVAKELHDSSEYSAAAEYYWMAMESATENTGALTDDSRMLPWIQEQVARCAAHQGPSEVPHIVVAPSLHYRIARAKAVPSRLSLKSIKE